MQRGRDLDRELRDLGPRIEYPPTPDLAGSVRSQLEAENGAADSPTRTGPQIWWIAAAALVLLVALPALAFVVTTMGGSPSGGGGMAQSGGGGPGRERQAGVSERTQPPLAMESGAASSAGSGPSGGACFSPEPILEVKPSRGTPGNELGIRGRHFDGDLRDCDADAARDVRIEFLQDGRTWDLGRLVSDKDSRLAAKLRVPADARPGPATVRAAYGQGPPGDSYGRQSAEARFFVTN